jgi:hypothetical protein
MPNVVKITPTSSSQYCPKCRKTMQLTKFYTFKDGTKPELCKSCLTMHVNNYDPETFLWLLEMFDVPYVEDEWNKIRDREYKKDPFKMNGMSVLGRYLSLMKLNQWKKYTWKDTEALKQEAQKNAEASLSDMEQKLEHMKIAVENGDLSQEQFDVYEKMYAEATASPPPEAPIEAPAPPPEQFTSDSPYPLNSDFEQVDLPDVGANLTEEDKIYLALKWGRLYRAEDWVALEQLYEEFMNTFDIQGAARIDTLKMICKTSLKMNQAIDAGDIETYQKLSRVYDAMMKSAKFTEAQRKEEKADKFDAVGQIVYFAEEKGGGAIPRYKIDTPLDIVDKAIMNLKKYTHDLIVNDPTLSQMFENFIKLRQSAMEQKKDMEQAEAEGLDYVPIEDKDYIDFNNLIQEDKEKDKELHEEDGE